MGAPYGDVSTKTGTFGETTSDDVPPLRKRTGAGGGGTVGVGVGLGAPADQVIERQALVMPGSVADCAR